MAPIQSQLPRNAEAFFLVFDAVVRWHGAMQQLKASLVANIIVKEK